MMCWSHMLHPWNCFENCALLESKLDNDGLNKPKCVNTMFIFTNQRIFLGSVGSNVQIQSILVE